MEQGRDFLRQQVDNAIMQHRTLLQNLRDHAEQAEDARYRSLCERYIPETEEHQQVLEDYGRSVGAEGGKGLKKAIGVALGAARDTVDAVREDDFLRVVGDTVTIRQSQDTFGTFATVGDKIGEPRLAEIGRKGERDHDQMQRDFNELANQLFVENVKDM